jgi:hypothetical protein
MRFILAYFGRLLPKVVAAVRVALRAGQAIAAVVAGVAASAVLAASDAPRLAADDRLLARDDGRGRCSRRNDRSRTEQAEGGDPADEVTTHGVHPEWLNVPECIGIPGLDEQSRDLVNG